MIDALTHGWAGIATGYAAVQAPMVLGLIHARAQLRQYLTSPAVAVPLTAVAAVGIAISSAWLRHFGIEAQSWAQLAWGTGLSATLGYAAGVGLAHSTTEARHHRRGFGWGVQLPTESRSRGHTADAGLTLAGMRVPSQDETKHFKLIRTTGPARALRYKNYWPAPWHEATGR
jgi:hypothetical protein